MNRVLKMACLVGVLASAGAHAELYKWVGPDGKISYSDTPPPSVAKQVEAKPIATVGGAGGVGTLESGVRDGDECVRVLSDGEQLRLELLGRGRQDPLDVEVIQGIQEPLVLGHVSVHDLHPFG